MFRELEFQSKVFNTLEAYLDALVARKANADKVAKVNAENPNIDIPMRLLQVLLFRVQFPYP